MCRDLDIVTEGRKIQAAGGFLILSIDFGSTNTDVVLFDGKLATKKAGTQEKLFSAAELESFLKKAGFAPQGIDAVAVTGGKSAFFTEKIFGLAPVHINEIDAIGSGAAFLAKQERCLVVSMGTGTCIVLFDNGKCTHVIGTGVGGGTITGLSRLLLGETNIPKLNSLADNGKTENIDLTIGDVVGKKFSMLNEKVTASNFAKPENCGKADLAAGIQNLVAESVAVLAVSAAKQCNCGAVVFCGKTPSFAFVKKRLLGASRLFGGNFLFPKNFEFATAIGAAIILQKKQGLGKG